MGLAFGAAVMIGAIAAVLDGFQDALMLAATLILMAIVMPDRARRLAALGVIGLVCGYGLTSLRDIEPTQQPLPPDGETVTGIVTSDPRLAARGKTVTVEWMLAGEKRREALLFYSGIDSIGRGDKVEATGAWSPRRAPLFFAERVVVTKRADSGERIRRSFRDSARERVLARVPGSNGSLALGLVIGDDSGLTEMERDHLRFAGLSHITAVSGSNVALVIGAVAFILSALNRTSWIWLALQVAGIGFYVWIVGLDPPIVRAAIMGSLALLAIMVGRPAHLFTLLALAGAVMCLLDPNVPVSLGFQLSFLSMIGLALAGDLIARTEDRRRRVAAALLSPIGAALLTAPLLAARFGTVSLGTVPANIIVAPLIGPATLLTGLVAILPRDFVTGQAIGMLVWLATGFTLAVAGIVGGASWSVITFAPLSPSHTVGIYLFLALCALPLVPEARVTGYRVGVWARADPVRASVTASGAAGMVVAFALLLD